MSPISHPVLDLAAAAEHEESLLHADERLSAVAMRRAGESLADALLRDYAEVGPVPDSLSLLILCGAGHNGGDALHAARRILELNAGAVATLLMAREKATLRPLTLAALEELQALASGRLEILHWDEACAAALAGRRFDICIEGLAGMGMKLPLREPMAEIVRVANGLDIALRAAVDLPVGLGGEAAFRANFSYATGIAKSPLFEDGAVKTAGRVRYLDLGFFDASAGPDSLRRILLSSILRPLKALRPAFCDKRSFGNLFLLGGSRNMPGAIGMAAIAAAQAGAGLLSAIVPANLSSRLAPLVPEAMWHPMPVNAEGAFDPDELLRGARRCLTKASCLAAGPGMEPGRDLRVAIARLVRDLEIPVLLDAGAVCEETASAAAGRKAAAPPVVFTPHMGEFARLVGSAALADPEVYLMDFCARSRSIVLLKGPVTRICDGRHIYLSTLGGPVLARGGSGDMLSGIIAALLAKPGMEPLEAVCMGALWHGLAAERLARHSGQQGVRTTELAAHMAFALRES